MNGEYERELKLAAPRRFSLARLQPQLDRYSVAPAEFHRLHTVYYDTADLRLARWGCSLRFRHGEGWTLKLPVPADAEGLVREEHLFAGDERTVPPAAYDLATAYLRGAPLAAVAELRTLRTSRALSSKRGARIASVVEDDVHVVEGTHVVKRFRQIEIELGRSAPGSVLADLGAQLRRSGAGKPDPVPKNVRALGRRNVTGELPAEADRGASAARFARAALARPLEALVRVDAVLRTRPDAEAVHRARVSVRRLRSRLKTLRPLLEAGPARELRERLKWLQDGLSQARDGDVFLERTRRIAAGLPGAGGRAAEGVLAPFEAARIAAYQRVAALLHDERYVTLVRDAIEFAKAPPLRRRASRPASAVGPRLVDDAWTRLRTRIRRRSTPPSDRELHAIRIAAKDVRYIAEALEPVAGERAGRLARAAEALQSVLGDQHDAVVACERLRSAAHAAGHAFVAGELAAAYNAAAVEARGRWPRAWRRAKRHARRFMRVR